MSNRKTIIVGRVKGSIWYSGKDFNDVLNPIENDLFLRDDGVIYQYINNVWEETGINLFVEKDAEKVEEFNVRTSLSENAYNDNELVTSKAVLDILKKNEVGNAVTINTEQVITGIKKFHNKVSAPYLYLDCVGDINDGTANYSYIDRGLTNFCNIRIGPGNEIYFVRDEAHYSTKDIFRIDRSIIIGANNIIDTRNSSNGHLYNIALFADGSTVRGSNTLTTGWGNVVNNNATSALGVNLQTGSNQLGQLVIGEWNVRDGNAQNPSYFMIGNGTADNSRHNVLSIEKNGIWFGGSNTNNEGHRIDKYITYKDLGKLIDIAPKGDILNRIANYDLYKESRKISASPIPEYYASTFNTLSLGTNNNAETHNTTYQMSVSNIIMLGNNHMSNTSNVLLVGYNNTAEIAAGSSILAGSYLKSSSMNSLSIGTYNAPVSGAFFQIGDGTADHDRHNLISVEPGGIWFGLDKTGLDGNGTWFPVDKMKIWLSDYRNGFSKEYVDNLVASIPKYQTTVVETLPEVGQAEVVYLVLDEEDGDSLYKEYIYVNGTWERLGTAKIKLDDYALKSEVPTKLSDLEIDMELGINEEEVLEVVESNSEEVEELETEVADSMDVQETETFDIATSGNYNVESDTQVPTTKAVKSMVDSLPKDYNELINKPIIPSIDGLATTEYVDNKKIYFHKLSVKVGLGDGDFADAYVNMYSTSSTPATTIQDVRTLAGGVDVEYVRIISYIVPKVSEVDTSEIGYLALYFKGNPHIDIYIQGRTGSHIAHTNTGWSDYETTYPCVVNDKVVPV